MRTVLNREGCSMLHTIHFHQVQRASSLNSVILSLLHYLLLTTGGGYI